jgi:hypothetical protein
MEIQFHHLPSDIKLWNGTSMNIHLFHRYIIYTYRVIKSPCLITRGATHPGCYISHGGAYNISVQMYGRNAPWFPRGMLWVEWFHLMTLPGICSDHCGWVIGRRWRFFYIASLWELQVLSIYSVDLSGKCSHFCASSCKGPQKLCWKHTRSWRAR